MSDSAGKTISLFEPFDNGLACADQGANHQEAEDVDVSRKRTRTSNRQLKDEECERAKGDMTRPTCNIGWARFGDTMSTNQLVVDA